MIIPNTKSVSRTGPECEDLFTNAFLKNREIYLFDEVTDAVAAVIIAQLNYLDRAGKDEIRLFLNTSGGSVSAGLSIVDAINRCSCSVSTICTGMAASMGAVLLACGRKGRRFATPNAEIMIHQPLGGVSGQASDMELAANHIAKIKKNLYGILSQATGQSTEKISSDCDRDYFLTTDEGIEYGIIDGLYESNK